MPFPPKKPEDEKKLEATAPTKDGPKPFAKTAPAEGTPAKGGPPKGAKPAAPGDAKPTPGASKPAGEGTPKTTSPDRKAKGGGGNSAPETPGQGVPERKQAEQSGKKEPEADKEALPKEGNEGKKPAAEQPKGLASVAVMTKAEAESAAKDPMNNPHVQRLASAVHGLAKIVQDLHAKVGAMPLPGQQQAQPGKPGMPMPGAKPAMPGAKPGMPVKPGMAGQKPGAMGQTMMPNSGMQKPNMGTPTGGAAAMTPTLALEQVREMMVIIEATNTGRISSQAAAVLISTGFGLAPEVAQAMVAGNATAPAPGAAPVPGAGPDATMLNPEEEELEEGLEEGEEGLEGEDEEEPVAAAPAEEDPYTYSKFRRKTTDSVDDEISTAIANLEARRDVVDNQLNALEYARAVMDYDDDQPRDESGRWSAGGGGGGGGGKNEGGGKASASGKASDPKDKSVPHATLDPLWRPKNQPEVKEKKVRPANRYHAEAREAEAAGDRRKAERLFKLADAVKGERDVVKARIREEVKNAAKNGAPKAHPATRPQGKDEYFKTNAHPDNIKKLKTPEVKAVKYLGGGANDTNKLTMEDGSKATWKPAGGERDGLRTNVPVGTYYVREAAASNLARVIGVQDLVPAVVAFHGPYHPNHADKHGVKNEHGPFGSPKAGEPDEVANARETGVVGSMHAWAPGTAMRDMWTVPQLNRDACERARVFDYITGNSDRHAGNMLVNERDNDNFPVLIDNGLAFNTRGIPDRVISPPETLRWSGLLDSTKTMIKDIDVKEVAKTLKNSGLDRPASKLAIQRLLHLKSDPDYLDSKGSRYDAQFVYDWSDHSKKAEAERVLKAHEDLAEQHISAYDGSR